MEKWITGTPVALMSTANLASSLEMIEMEQSMGDRRLDRIKPSLERELASRSDWPSVARPLVTAA